MKRRFPLSRTSRFVPRLRSVRSTRFGFVSVAALGLAGCAFLMEANYDGASEGETASESPVDTGSDVGVTTLRAGLLRENGGIAYDSGANVFYVTHPDAHTIQRISAAGVVEDFVGTQDLSGHADAQGGAARLYQPTGVAVDSTNHVIFFADRGNHTVRKIDEDGNVSTHAIPTVPTSLARPGPTPAPMVPEGIARASNGVLYIADTANHSILKLSADGNALTILAGDFQAGPGFADGTGENAKFWSPLGLALDANETALYVTDSGNVRIRKIDLSTLGVTTIVGDSITNQVIDGTGYTAGVMGTASIAQPKGIAVASDGTVFFNDLTCVRKIEFPSGGSPIVTTIAGMGAFGGPSRWARFGRAFWCHARWDHTERGRRALCQRGE